MKIKDDRFTIQTIKSIYAQLLEEYNSKDKIKINFANVDEIDISAVQLLLSLKQSCEKNNKSFRLTNIKDEILYSLEIVGVDSMLGV